jgi:hypothetical protein
MRGGPKTGVAERVVTFDNVGSWRHRFGRGRATLQRSMARLAGARGHRLVAPQGQAGYRPSASDTPIDWRDLELHCYRGTAGAGSELGAIGDVRGAGDGT